MDSLATPFESSADAASSIVRAMTQAECERCAQVVLRLCSELDAFLSQVTRSRRTALGLSRNLNIDRNTCQRALAALANTGEPLRALLRLPGPKGLRQLAEAGGASGTKSRKRQPLLAAIEQFESLIWDLGPSQSKLLLRVKATLEPVPAAAVHPLDADKARIAHFNASAALTGIDMDVHITVGALRRIPAQPDRFEQVGVTGWVGMRSRGPGLPFSVGTVTLKDRMGEVADVVHVSPIGSRLTENEGLIEAFSSKPLPQVTARSEGGVAIQYVDLRKQTQAKPSDIILARHRAPIEDPRSSGDPVWSQIARIKYPARRMILDLFLERSIAIGTPWSASYLWHPSLTGHPQRHWHERLPGTLRVSVLGVGLSMAKSEIWNRYDAMLAHVFSTVGWPAEEFIGYRCEIDYPIWGATYFLSFDFGSTGAV